MEKKPLYDDKFLQLVKFLCSPGFLLCSGLLLVLILALIGYETIGVFVLIVTVLYAIASYLAD